MRAECECSANLQSDSNHGAGKSNAYPLIQREFPWNLYHGRWFWAIAQQDLQKLVWSAKELTVVEPSVEQLQQSRNAWPVTEVCGTIHWIQADAASLDFDDGSFDLVVISDLLKVSSWGRWVLQDVHRMLKDRGHLILSLSIAADGGGFNKIRKWIAKAIGWIIQNDGKGSDGPKTQDQESGPKFSISSVEMLGFQVTSWIPDPQDSTGHRYSVAFRKSADPAWMRHIRQRKKESLAAEQKTRQDHLARWLSSHPQYRDIQPRELESLRLVRAGGIDYVAPSGRRVDRVWRYYPSSCRSGGQGNPIVFDGWSRQCRPEGSPGGNGPNSSA